MNLSKAACDKIERALNHYLHFREEFGRTASEQIDLDDKHRLELYNALEELTAYRKSLSYGDLFGMVNLTPILAPNPRDYKTEAAYLEAVDKFNDFRAQIEYGKDSDELGEARTDYADPMN